MQLQKSNLIANVAILVVATSPGAACVPFLGLASWIIQRVYLRTSRQIRLMDLEAKAPLYTHFLETLSDIVTIRSVGLKHIDEKITNTLTNHKSPSIYST